jgi:hypothetical protein
MPENDNRISSTQGQVSLEPAAIVQEGASCGSGGRKAIEA